jgi:hypothetical protein
MTISRFVTAFEHRLVARNKLATDLEERISRIEAKRDLRVGGRLASRLTMYRQQLSRLNNKVSEQNCWIGTVALPVFSILEKRLGIGFRGVLIRDRQDRASLRFIQFDGDMETGLVLNLTIDWLCTDPQKEAVGVSVVRSIIRSGLLVGTDDHLPLDTPLAEVFTPLCAA